jgi:hypothetical protein
VPRSRGDVRKVAYSSHKGRAMYKVVEYFCLKKRWAREEARLAEEARRANLTIWERIEESDASDSVKELLHMLAEKCGLEN